MREELQQGKGDVVYPLALPISSSTNSSGKRQDRGCFPNTPEAKCLNSLTPALQCDHRAKGLAVHLPPLPPGMENAASRSQGPTFLSCHHQASPAGQTASCLRQKKRKKERSMDQPRFPAPTLMSTCGPCSHFAEFTPYQAIIQ